MQLLCMFTVLLLVFTVCSCCVLSLCFFVRSLCRCVHSLVAVCVHWSLYAFSVSLCVFAVSLCAVTVEAVWLCCTSLCSIDEAIGHGDAMDDCVIRRDPIPVFFPAVGWHARLVRGSLPG